MDHRKLLELAIKGLEAERGKLDVELAVLRQQLGVPIARPKAARKAVTAKKRTMTAKQKKAISARMKALWAARRKKE
jgi:hypothetical protein